MLKCIFLVHIDCVPLRDFRNLNKKKVYSIKFCQLLHFFALLLGNGSFGVSRDKHGERKVQTLIKCIDAQSSVIYDVRILYRPLLVLTINLMQRIVGGVTFM